MKVLYNQGNVIFMLGVSQNVSNRVQDQEKFLVQSVGVLRTRRQVSPAGRETHPQALRNGRAAAWMVRGEGCRATVTCKGVSGKYLNRKLERHLRVED